MKVGFKLGVGVDQKSNEEVTDITPYEYSHGLGHTTSYVGHGTGYGHGYHGYRYGDDSYYAYGDHGYAYGAPHHEAVYESYHVTHPELDHKYDDQHDIEPVHFHEHAVLPAVLHPDRHSYDDGFKFGLGVGVAVDDQQKSNEEVMDITPFEAGEALGSHYTIPSQYVGHGGAGRGRGYHGYRHGDDTYGYDYGYAFLS